MNNWISNVKLFTDGVDEFNAATFNPVITSLAQRDQYLFDQINSYSDKTVLLSYNQPLAANNFIPGTPVYFNTSGGQVVLDLAKAGFASNGPHIEPAQSAFIFGLIKQTYTGGLYGDIYVRGLVTGVNFSLVLDSVSLAEGVLTPGPLYLSGVEAGKLSTQPDGASIFIGYYLGNDSLVLAPNIDSLNQLFFNYQVYLQSVAAGSPSQTSGTWSISSPDFISTVGWVNASDAATYYGMTAPSGAVFYYNLPVNSQITNSGLSVNKIKDAILLKQALPAYPGAYTMLFANGVLQTQYDADHDTGSYILNENGIWWTNNTTNYTPWATGGGSLELKLCITKLNPNYASTVVTELSSPNNSIKIVDENNLPAKTGNLAVQLNLPITNTLATASGYCIQSLSFDAPSGVLNLNTSPVISAIGVGPGLTMTQTPAKTTIALGDFSTGEVLDIEPEEAEFVYKGLNSYLRLKNPAVNQKIGFVGKVRIPSNIPANSNLYIKLNAFTDDPLAGTSGNIGFLFEYSNSNSGITIASSVTSSTITIPNTSFNTGISSLTQTEVYLDNSGNPYFTIPGTSFSPNSYINFRISRLNSAFTKSIGIIGVTWLIQ